MPVDRGFEIAFVDGVHEDFPGSGEDGVLAVAGRLPLGYNHDPDATARMFREVDGVRYATPGDRARVRVDGRIELLLHQAGVVRDAYRCPACGRASLTATSCPLDGTTMEHRDDGLDLAVRLTLAYGGDLLAVEQGQDLEPVEGIGAVLRF